MARPEAVSLPLLTERCIALTALRELVHLLKSTLSSLLG
jgi:hypothetical protein